VSQFIPTSIEFDSPDVPETLASALVKALSRRFIPRLSWRLSQITLSALGGGLAALAVLPFRFIQFAAAESQRFIYLADWLRTDSADPEPAQLLQMAPWQASRPYVAVIWALAAAAVVAAVRFFCLLNVSPNGWLTFSPTSWVVAWIDLLTGGRFAASHGTGLSAPALHAAHLYAWAVGLASVFWLMMVRHRARLVGGYVQTLNRIIARRQLPPIPRPAVPWGLRPVWLAMGLIWTAAGALWALPFFIAAAAHREFMLRQSLPMRLRMAQSVCQLLTRRQPPLALPTPPTPPQRCIRRLCAAPMPAGAMHCPRCGAAAV
jgi:hypothetical protein